MSLHPLLTLTWHSAKSTLVSVWSQWLHPSSALPLQLSQARREDGRPGLPKVQGLMPYPIKKNLLLKHRGFNPLVGTWI